MTEPLIISVVDGVMRDHKRDDVLAMLKRGDYG